MGSVISWAVEEVLTLPKGVFPWNLYFSYKYLAQSVTICKFSLINVMIN